MDRDGGVFSEAGDASVRPENGRSGTEGFDLVALEYGFLLVFVYDNGLVPDDKRFSLGGEHIWVYLFGYDRGAFGKVGKKKESYNRQKSHYNDRYGIFSEKSLGNF